MIYLLHNIGEPINSNYNSPEQISASRGELTFDGIYKNVYEHRHILKDRDVTLFVMGNYVGKDNSFDKPMPLEKYCDWNEIMELVNIGCKLGWHTWSHPDLTTLSYEEVLKEVTPPFPMESFAYPYGKFNDTVIKAVKEAGFKKAYTVVSGDETDYQIPRFYL